MKTMLPALLKLLLVLAAVSHGTATFCNITETKTSVQCYGALGQSVLIYPFNTSSEIVELQVFFQTKSFFRYKDKKGPIDGTCQNRCQFMTNGTIRLHNLKKSDNGNYTFDESDKKGKNKKKIVSLTIQDPVSPPVLSQLCLSHEEIRVNCSSTGEHPQYSWALDNRTLDGGVAFLSNETQTVILRRNVSGSITCTASNRVSREHTTQELQKCPGPVTLSPHTPTNEPAPLPTEEGSATLSPHPHTPTNEPAPLPTEEGSSGSVVLFAVLGVCLSLMVLLLGSFCLYKKQKQTKTSQRIAGDSCEDPQEVVYSQVQVVKKKQSPKKQEQEAQVVYGEVNFRGAGDRCEDPQEVVYSQVQVVKEKQRPKKQEQEPQVVYGEVKVSDASKAVRPSPNEQTDTIYSGIRT